MSPRAYYHRQLGLPEVGSSGQARLGAATVAVVGLGALGCPAAAYLVRAGVGEVHLVDGDTVDETNLHRQPLYDPTCVGGPKVAAAAARLRDDNPHVRVLPHERFLDAAGALPPSRSGRIDLVLDCTDRFSSRFAVHDACLREGVPLLSAAVQAFTGQIHHFRFDRPEGPCLRCLYPTAPDDGCTGSCGQDGILGAAAGVVGSLQALFALRLLLDASCVPEATTYTIDLSTLAVHSMTWGRSSDCPSCGAGRRRSAASRRRQATGRATGRATGPEPGATGEAEASAHGDTPLVLDIRNEWEVRELDRLFLPGARLLPQAVLRETMQDLDRRAGYLLVCETGARSRRMMEEMRRAGFRSVSHLAGGYAKLRQAVEAADESPDGNTGYGAPGGATVS